MSDWARKTADKYISRTGKDPGHSGRAHTEAEKAWRVHAETVHRFLRPYASTSEGKEALAALERIGDAIANDERRRR